MNAENLDSIPEHRHGSLTLIEIGNVTLAEKSRGRRAALGIAAAFVVSVALSPSPSVSLKRRADAAARVPFQNTASAAGDGANGVALPKTATDPESKMLAGPTLLLLAVLLMMRRRTLHLVAR
jgi:hypothetical protein